MKRVEIKKFFKLLEQGKKAYPKLQQFIEEVDRLILMIIQTVLTFFNAFLKSLNTENQEDEKQTFHTFNEQVINYHSFFSKEMILRAPLKIN